MLGAIYLALIPLLSYLSGNRDSIIALLGICMIILADLLITDLFKVTLDNFFLFRAIVDLTLLLLIYKLPLVSIKRYVVSLLVFVSTIINVYLCFDLGNVFVYRHWETINLVLCELIFVTLIISDRSWTMWSQFKLYIYGAVAAAGLFLFGWLKYLSAKNESLEKELKTEKQNAAVKDDVVKIEKKISENLEKVREESQKVHDENNQKRINKVRPNHGDSFNDPRL